MRKLLSSLFALLLLGSLAFTAFAVSPSVTFQSKEDGFSFSPGSRYSPTDLFPGFKDVLPGDRLEETISVKNTHSGKLRLFLDFQGGEEDLEFLRQLHLQVYSGDALLFSDCPDQSGERAFLGTLAPGESQNLRVSLDVPLSLDNTFAARRGDVIWVFSAEEVPDDTLIQTGQLLWPIGLLALLGFLSLILGSILLLRKRHG